MLRVVLPLTTINLVRLIKVVLVEVCLVKVVVNVLVIIIYVLVIHIDVHIAAPPSAIPTPATAPRRSKGDPGAECNRRSRYIIPWRRVIDRWIRICRCPINHSRIVRGNINHIGIGWLNHDSLLAALDRLSLYCLLLASF